MPTALGHLRVIPLYHKQMHVSKLFLSQVDLHIHPHTHTHIHPPPHTQTPMHMYTHTCIHIPHPHKPLTNLAMLNHQTSYLYFQVIADQGGVKDRGTQRGRGGPEGAGAGATHRQHHLASHALPQRAVVQLKATLLHTVTGLHKTKPHHWSGHDKTSSPVWA